MYGFSLASFGVAGTIVWATNRFVIPKTGPLPFLLGVALVSSLAYFSVEYLSGVEKFKDSTQ